MSRADSEAIAEIVNRAHPGRAHYFEPEGMSHGFQVGNKFYAELVPAILKWMKECLAAGK